METIQLQHHEHQIYKLNRKIHFLAVRAKVYLFKNKVLYLAKHQQLNNLDYQNLYHLVQLKAISHLHNYLNKKQVFLETNNSHQRVYCRYPSKI